MPVVVSLAAYKNKATLTAVRELLVLAAKGQIVGLKFDAQLKNGQVRRCVTGEFVDSEDANVPVGIISLPVRLSRE